MISAVAAEIGRTPSAEHHEQRVAEVSVVSITDPMRTDAGSGGGAGSPARGMVTAVMAGTSGKALSSPGEMSRTGTLVNPKRRSEHPVGQVDRCPHTSVQQNVRPPAAHRHAACGCPRANFIGEHRWACRDHGLYGGPAGMAPSAAGATVVSHTVQSDADMSSAPEMAEGADDADHRPCRESASFVVDRRRVSPVPAINWRMRR